jgi:hypothetical protein
MHNSTPIVMSCILVVKIVSHGFIVWCMYRLSHFVSCKLLEPRCDHVYDLVEYHMHPVFSAVLLGITYIA